MTLQHGFTRWSAALLLSLLLGTVALPVQAQGFLDRFSQDEKALVADAGSLPSIPANGTCPDRDDGDGGERRSFRDHRRALLLTAPRQIILPDVPIYRDAALSETLRDLELAFQQEVRVLRWNAGRVESHLVKFDTERGPRCGWIDNSALLPQERQSPLLIRDLHRAGLGDIFGSESEASTLDAKVLVRNRFDKEDDETAKGARVYYRFTDAEPYRTLRIFNVLNIFDVAEHEGERWFFVGGERATEEGGVKQNLYGWVRADEVIPWSSLINVYYAPGKRDLKIYEDNREAQREGEWFAEQAESESPKDKNTPRFPLLDTLSVPGTWLHKIAFPGRACTSDGECISAEAYAGERGGVAAEVWKAENIDFLFVIDATESMVRYFPLVIQGIREFLNDIDPGDRKRVRFSTIVYGDFLSRTGDGFQFARVIPFGSTGGAKELDVLLKAKPFSDNMSDLPEAAFGALAKSIKEASWRKSAGWRMVVWIGDHPNRASGRTGNRRLSYTEEDVAQAFAEAGNGVWAAINVRGRFDRAYNDLFIAQGGRVLDLIDDYGFPPRQAYDADGSKETDAQVVQSVRDNLHGILFAGKEVPRILEMMAAGKEVSEDVLQNASAVLAMKYVRDRLGLSDAEIKDFFKRSQLVREGWIRQNPASPDYQYWVSLKVDEIDNLVNASEELCETLSDEAPDFNRIKDAMVATLKGVTGDVPKVAGEEDETNIRIYLAKRLHVPVEHFSPLLDKDIDRFVDWYMKSPPSETEEFKVSVCKKATLMRLTREAKRVDGDLDAITFNKRLRTWQARDGSTRKFNWIWGTEHGIFYYYVPLDYIL